jgi:hypothetical protein
VTRMHTELFEAFRELGMAEDKAVKAAPWC